MTLSSARESQGSTLIADYEARPLLSVCIPTYNRKSIVVELVTKLLRLPGPFEIRVHDDGSTDGATEALGALRDPKFHLTIAPNAGRAAALANAVSGAIGRFTMLFDDDDELWPDGLVQVLKDCARSLPAGVAGYVYHLSDDSGMRLGDSFPTTKSNFLQLRNDFRVRGDKKEVVLTDLLKPIVMDAQTLGRRVPTSLYWTTIALEHDVICRNVDIGRKHYEKGGMSDRIRGLKASNPRPLCALYRVHASGFRRGRFRSLVAAARSRLALAYHYGRMMSSRAVARR
jgi:glycosyltransferase involved in cell wall biosynthesis